MLFTNYFVKPRDILSLVEFTDNAPFIADTRKILVEIKIAFIISEILHLGARLIVISVAVLAGYGFVTFDQLIAITCVVLIISFLESFLSNKSVYESSYLLEMKIIRPILTRMYPLFGNKKYIIDTFRNNYANYFYNLSNLEENVVGLILIIISFSFTNTSLQMKSYAIVYGFFALGLIILGGWYWNSVISKYISYTNKECTPPTEIRVKRWLVPSISNLLKSDIFYLVLIFVLKNSQYSLLPLLGMFGALIGTGWNVVENLQKFYLANNSLQKLLKILGHNQKRYILNNYSYKRLASNCMPATQVNNISKQHKSLFIKEFIPMYYKNLKRITHIYNFEFKPGIYQLNGINGVGKSTLLKSLTLPENILVPMSKGEVSFCGKPFFDPSGTLESHRLQYRYISSETRQFNINESQLFVYDDYPLIQTFLKSFIEQKKEIQSEGEKAILSICNAFYDSSIGINEGLIFVDEMISRIYGRKDLPLRQEITKMLFDMLKLDDTLIIIVVDHMSEIIGATQLNIKPKSIDVESIST